MSVPLLPPFDFFVFFFLVLFGGSAGHFSLFIPMLLLEGQHRPSPALGCLTASWSAGSSGVFGEAHGLGVHGPEFGPRPLLTSLRAEFGTMARLW